MQEAARHRRVRCEPNCDPCNCLLRRDKLKKIGRCVFSLLFTYLIMAYMQSKWSTDFKAVKNDLVVLSLDIYTKIGATETKTKETFVQLKAFDEELKKIKKELAVNMVESVSKQVTEMIKKEISIYDADKTGLADYALLSLGGCIASTRNTKVFTENCSQFSILGLPLLKIESDPKTIIKGPIVPGKCWAIAGSEGAVVIQLATSIRVTNVSIEHMPVALSPTGAITSAPKRFSVWGLQSVDDDEPQLLGKFEYKVPGPSLQTFSIPPCGTKVVPYVELKVLSNHGNKDFTCLYRVRVHGKPCENH